MHHSAHSERGFNPLAAVCAWLWPGLGHIVLGEAKRGVLIMAGILFLIACGLLVGGVTVVDRVDDRLWFLAQSMCGPLVFALDWVNQSVVKGWSEEALLTVRSFSRVREMGILFIALAGLMNLVVILDALSPPHRPQPQPPERRRPSSDRRAESGSAAGGTEQSGEGGGGR